MLNPLPSIGLFLISFTLNNTPLLRWQATQLLLCSLLELGVILTLGYWCYRGMLSIFVGNTLWAAGSFLVALVLGGTRTVFWITVGVKLLETPSIRFPWLGRWADKMPWNKLDN